MANIDISNLSFEEIKSLKSAVDRRFNELAGVRRSVLLKELEELDKIIHPQDEPSFTTTKGRRGVMPPRYCSPDGRTWSGFGHTPKWIVEYEKSGGSRQDWRVKENENGTDGR